MRRTRIIGCCILVVFFVLAFTACPTSVDMRLEPTTAYITGRVLLSNGTNHGDIVVTLEETSGPLSASVVNLSRGVTVGETSITAIAQTDAQGRFSFRDVPPGTYTLHARSWDSLERAVATIPITVRAGDELDVGILNLTLAGSISGQITVNGLSAGSAGFIVSVAGTSFMAVTCEEGLFRISGVPAGDHRLIVVRGNFTVFIPGTVGVSGGVNTYLDETKNITSEDLYHNTPRIVGGYWWVGDRNLKIPATGPQGDVPFIGEDGYWWIGTDRTNVPARGPQGPAGVSIVWKGELDAAPLEPQLNWAFFNTYTRNAYIWNGTRWYILAQRGGAGADGDTGAAGVSINWLGTFEEHPENPELNWAYHNSVRGVSYIFDGEGWQVLVRDGVVGPGGPKGPEGPGGPTGFVPVTSVSLDDVSHVMALGETHTPVVTVAPPYATIATVLWSSSRPNVASVDMFNGTITAHAPGETTITVLTVQGGMTATIDVLIEGTVAGPASPLAGRLLILQAGAAGSNGAIGRNFIELYNNTYEDIDLDGFSLQYAAGSSTNPAWLATETAPWTVIPLTGTIPAGGSFLVVGNFVESPANQRFTITDEEADLVVADMRLSNRSFKVALMANPYRLTVANPFAMPRGGTAVNFVDLLGALNSPPGDGIDASEVAPVVGISQQASVRRRSLIDTNNNSVDFVRVDFRHIPGEGTPSNAGGTSIVDFERVRPRNSHDGSWAPFSDVDDSPVAGESPYARRLLILQIGATVGPAGGSGSISRTFIELYNTTDIPIDLNGFSLQFANAIGTDWTVVSLAGTIPARGSFLVVGQIMLPGAQLQIVDADMVIPNNGRLSTTQFKVVLMANLNRLTVANPFTMSGGGGRADGFVDMVGAVNATANIDAYETTPAGPISSHVAIRRRSLVDTDNNGADFVRIDYSRGNFLSDRFRPRSSSYGAWDPFPEIVWGEGTGLPSLHVSISPHEWGGPYSLDRNIWRPTTVSMRGVGPYAEFMFEGVRAEARGRGNTSWREMGNKRPLRIRFNTVRPMFGSSYAARDWTLIASAQDHSMVRNYSAYFLGSLLDGLDFSPARHFLHLYMDGEYRGVYMLSDQMHVHPGRVELVSNLDPELSEYFLEWCWRVVNEGGPYFIVQGIAFGIEFPGSGILNQNLGHLEFVRDFIMRVDATLMRGNFDEISQVIDIPSFIDFYLVHELFKVPDVNSSSLFFQVRQLDNGPKLFAGPLWDFDDSSGVILGPWNSPQGVWAAERNRFFRYLMNIGQFREHVGERWREIRGREVVTMINRITYLTQKYQTCFERNFERWPDKNVRSNIPPRLIEMPFIEQVNYLTNWFQQRKLWMDGFLQ